MTRPIAGVIVVVAMTAVLATGCSSAQSAIDRAQGAVDDAQSMVEDAAGLLSAPEGIASACTTAVSALAPGVPADTARTTLTRAASELDTALGFAADLPGVAGLRDTFTGALEALAVGSDATTTQAARDAIAGACAPFTTTGTTSP